MNFPLASICKLRKDIAVQKAWMGIWLMAMVSMAGLWPVALDAAAPVVPSTAATTSKNSAQKAVKVLQVRFDQKRLPGQSYPWLEASIGLRPEPGVSAENIQIKLWLSYTQPTGKKVFAGQVTLLSLMDPCTVRFYLPPDVLRAQRLSQTPTAYYMEISSSLGAESFDRAHASATLTTPAARNELKNTPVYAGLLPHYATPFYSQTDTYRDLPAYGIK